MATPENLIKYYICLRDNFNKLQDKQNQAALINAALRPKIREDLAGSDKLLVSYLNYIQVFSLIYEDKFSYICNNIVNPLFKEKRLKRLNVQRDCKVEPGGDTSDIACQIHETIHNIVRSKPELADDFAQSIVRVFPSFDDLDSQKNEAFLIYLKNSIKACTYLEGEPLIVVITKIIERLNPIPQDIEDKSECQDEKTLDRAYELLYECLDEMTDAQLDTFSTTILNTFAHDFLGSNIVNQMNYLLLYICSLKNELLDSLTNSLWNVFTDSSKPAEERAASVNFVSSLLSRAKYADLERVMSHIETGCNWCHEFLDQYKEDKDGNLDEVGCFLALTRALFYLITQRYREMYEEETIAKLKELNLTEILNCKLDPLRNCELELRSRLQEVLILYDVADCSAFDKISHKRRRSELVGGGAGGGGGQVSREQLRGWRGLSSEWSEKIPERVLSIYRMYYDPRNFTVYRE